MDDVGVRRFQGPSLAQTQGGRDWVSVAGALAVGVTVLAGSWNTGVSAQTYPAKMLRIIVAGPAGGPPDFVARTVAQHLTAGLGRQVIVENRPGAGGTIATAAAAKSPGDGYTLLLASTTRLAFRPASMRTPATIR